MTDRELVERAFAMHRFSYAPYSKFPVGAALLCADGTVFTGCNVENAAFGSAICAERTALLKAISEGHRDDWAVIAIAGQGSDYCWPCGSCRQMLYEFAPDLRVLAARGMGNFRLPPLRSCCPMALAPNPWCRWGALRPARRNTQNSAPADFSSGDAIFCFLWGISPEPRADA